jgi:hypothetical protein
LNNNFIIGFPGLNTNTLRTYPPGSAASVKGHLDQLRKNTQSTKPHALAQTDSEHNTANTETAYALHATIGINEQEDAYPEIATITHTCYASTFAPSTYTGMVYTDQTGRYTSHRVAATPNFLSYTITIVTQFMQYQWQQNQPRTS